MEPLHSLVRSLLYFPSSSVLHLSLCVQSQLQCAVSHLRWWGTDWWSAGHTHTLEDSPSPQPWSSSLQRALVPGPHSPVSPEPSSAHWRRGRERTPSLCQRQDSPTRYQWWLATVWEREKLTAPLYCSPLVGFDIIFWYQMCGVGIPARPNPPLVVVSADGSVSITVATPHSGVRDNSVDQFQFITQVCVCQEYW